MATATGHEAICLLFEDANKIPIAQLNPGTNRIDQCYIEADVALIWPYSSSVQRLSLLLAEKDIRLRKSKGQVKVTFHGDCARELAKTHVGIGDRVKLGLQDAAWSRTGDAVSTPGKKVDWDIDVSRRIKIEVRNADGTTAVIDATAQAPPASTTKGSIVEIDGPKTNGFIDVRSTGVLQPHSSPARRNTGHAPSSSFLDASLDPFADDDGYIDGRGRKRTKFARYSGSWQLLDIEEDGRRDDEQATPSSPLEQHVHATVSAASVQDVGQAEVEQFGADPILASEVKESTISVVPLSHDNDTTGADGRVTSTAPASEEPNIVVSSDILMAPPPLPLPTTQRRQPPDELQPPSTPTPVLRPLPSPGLALVSPLIERHGSSVGYFPLMSDPPIEIGAINGHAPELRQALGQKSTAALTEQLVNPRTGLFNAGDEFVSNVAEDVSRSRSYVDEIQDTGQLLSTENQDNVPSSLQLLEEDYFVLPEVISNDSPAAILDGVDLDALQEQIDQSNEHLHELVESQSEDEDLYGPPVTVQKTAETAQVSQETPDATGTTIQALLASSPPASSPRVSLMSQHSPDQSATSAGEIETRSRQALLSPVLIDSSSEEEEAEQSDSESEADGDDHVDALDAGLDLEEELVTELATKDTSFASSDEAGALETFVSEQEPETESPATAQTNDAIVFPLDLENTETTSDLMLERVGPNDQTDGAIEAFENESQRSQLRTEVMQVETSSMTSRGSFNYHMEERNIDEAMKDRAHENTIVPTARPMSIDDNVLITDEHKSGYTTQTTATVDINENQPPLELIAITAIDQLRPFPTEQARLNTGQYDPIQIATPAPTQERPPLAISDLQTINKMQLELPPSPKLTQDTNADAAALPPETGSPDEEKPADVDLPQINDHGPIQPSRITQRLSRRSFNSERIMTDFFTPRRSARNVQSSPTFSHTLPATAQHRADAIEDPTPPHRQLSSIADQADQATQPSTMQRGMKTSLSYYPQLSTILDYWNQQIDVMAVCATDPSPAKKAKSGPKDFQTLLFLVDPSSKDGETIQAAMFRPAKNALPSSRRGDILLLRNMTVQTHEHKAGLLSTDSSAWAVFRKNLNTDFDVHVNGPPVEYDKDEEREADRLSQWWSAEGQQQYPEMPVTIEQSADAVGTGPVSPRMTRSQRRRLDTEDQVENAIESSRTAGAAASVAGSQVSRDPKEPSSPLTVVSAHHGPSVNVPSSPPTPGHRRGHRRDTSEQSESLVHELRDGTKYVDDDGRRTSVSIAHELRDGRSYFDA